MDSSADIPSPKRKISKKQVFIIFLVIIFDLVLLPLLPLTIAIETVILILKYAKVRSKIRAFISFGIIILIGMGFTIPFASLFAQNYQHKPSVNTTENTVQVTKKTSDEAIVEAAVLSTSKTMCNGTTGVSIKQINGTQIVSYATWKQTAPLITQFSLDHAGNLSLTYTSTCLDAPNLHEAQITSYVPFNLELIETETDILVTNLKNIQLSLPLTNMKISVEVPTYNNTCDKLGMMPVYTVDITKSQFQDFTYTGKPYALPIDTLYATLQKDGVAQTINAAYQGCPTPTLSPTPLPTESATQKETDFKNHSVPMTIANLAKDGNNDKFTQVAFTAYISSFVQDSSGNTAGMDVTDDAGNNVQVEFPSGFGSNGLDQMNKGDSVKIWGIDGGEFSGQNAFGATIYEVGISASYLTDTTSGYSFDGF